MRGKGCRYGIGNAKDILHYRVHIIQYTLQGAYEPTIRSNWLPCPGSELFCKVDQKQIPERGWCFSYWIHVGNIGYGLGFCGCSWVLAGSLGGWCISVFTIIHCYSLRMQLHSVGCYWWARTAPYNDSLGGDLRLLLVLGNVRGICISVERECVWVGKSAYWVMGQIFSLRFKGILVNLDLRVYICFCRVWG